MMLYSIFEVYGKKSQAINASKSTGVDSFYDQLLPYEWCWHDSFVLKMINVINMPPHYPSPATKMLGMVIGAKGAVLVHMCQLEVNLGSLKVFLMQGSTQRRV